MLFQVNGFQLSNLKKSGDVVSVDIVANHLTEDSDGEIILKEAFNKETIDEFLNIGLIDYWHDSENKLLSKSERNDAIIGKPVAFNWKNGKPVITANLTANHPEVQKMIPHLEANQPVYAASVSGSKMVLQTTDSLGQEHRVIPKIKWTRLAIAPSPDVINTGKGLNVRLSKANEVSCEFSDIDVFARNFHIEEKELRKALLAPESSGDLYDSPGGSITKQSLEGSPVNLTLSDQDGLDLIDTFIKIKNKEIPMKKAEYLKHFADQKKSDFGQKSYGLINKYFKLKKGAKVTC
jgi:hypothetical protein